MTTDTNTEEFNAAYASKGSRVLTLLEEIRELVTELPADGSCGATDYDYETLRNTHLELYVIKLRLRARLEVRA
jgi:hypothetical protein